MIELFKKELASLSNDSEPFGGYWQFRKLAEISVNNDSYFQACMERFKEFPIEAIYEQIVQEGVSSCPLLSLNEAFRLREAAQANPSYWHVIFDYFVNGQENCKHMFGLNVVSESMVHAIRYCCSRERIATHYILHIIKFCLMEEYLDESYEAIDEIVAMATSNKMSPENFELMKGCIGEIPFVDEMYSNPCYVGPRDYDDDTLPALHKLRKAFGLPYKRADM